MFAAACAWPPEPKNNHDFRPVNAAPRHCYQVGVDHPPEINRARRAVGRRIRTRLLRGPNSPDALVDAEPIRYAMPSNDGSRISTRSSCIWMARKSRRPDDLRRRVVPAAAICSVVVIADHALPSR